MATDHDWDEIHDDSGVVIPPEVPQPGDDDYIEKRTFDTDDGLEASTNKPKDEDDDDFAPAGAPPATPPAGTPPAEPPVAENMSGIELYLSQFDIEAGMIQFEDGSAVHFNELDSARQAEVLQQLHSSQATSVEDKFGLDESEISLVNYLRQNNMSVDQMVDAMVREQMASMMTMQELAAENYAEMTPEAIYTKFLQETSPEATPEQLASDLAKAKELSNFAKLSESLRTQFTARQTAEVESANAKAIAEHTALVEEQRQQIVSAVLPMKEIAGLTLDNNIKNTVLDRILQTNEEGDSAFMDEVFAEPESLFKAAFWYTYGEAIVAQRDEYWKKEKSAAYKRGKEDALGITPTASPGRSFVAKSSEQPHTARSARKQEEDSAVSWEELHNT
jgi:hypothetical protein